MSKRRKIITGGDFEFSARQLGLKDNDIARIMNRTERTVRNWRRDGPDKTAARVLEWMTNDGFMPFEAKEGSKHG